MIFSALGTIALVTLPYASDRPLAIDRTLSYIALLIVGWMGLVLRLVSLAAVNVQAVFPDRGPGLWIAALGLVIFSRAAYEIAREPAYR